MKLPFLASLSAALFATACEPIDWDQVLEGGGPHVDVLLVGGSAYVQTCDPQLFGCEPIVMDATVDVGAGLVAIPEADIDVDDALVPYYFFKGGAQFVRIDDVAPAEVSATIDGLAAEAPVVAAPAALTLPTEVTRAAGPITFTVDPGDGTVVAWHSAVCGETRIVAMTAEVEGDLVTLHPDEVGDATAGTCIHTVGIGRRMFGGQPGGELLVTSATLLTFTSTP
jgi:hypothetical protein